MLFARLKGVPFVVQAHGMIIPSDHSLRKCIDRFVTVPLLSKAAAVVALNNVEWDALRKLGVSLSLLEILPNCIPLGKVSHNDAAITSRAVTPLVMFCGRLHPRKRVGDFIEMAIDLHRRGAQCRFLIIGPDDGEAHLVRAALTDPVVGGYIRYEGGKSHDDTLRAMSTAQVFVLPSVDEPYPMVLLEAMSLGIACVATTGCHIADQLRNEGAARIVPPGPADLADAVAELLTSDEAAKHGTVGRQFVQKHADPSVIGAALDSLYRRRCANLSSGTLHAKN
jgi:glycosyltransferase involved in cell wall biosynthesis